MIYRSSTLKVDIRDPQAPAFWNVDDFTQEVTLFRSLYAAWANNGTIFMQIGDQLLLVTAWDQADGMDVNLLDPLETYHRPRINAHDDLEHRHPMH